MMMRHSNLSLLLVAFLGGCSPFMDEGGDELHADDSGSDDAASSVAGSTSGAEGQSSSSSGNTTPGGSSSSAGETVQTASSGADDGATSTAGDGTSTGSGEGHPTSTVADDGTVGTTTTESSESTTVDDDERSSCEVTGGTWDPESCGHYVCGVMPSCRAQIPGCDCGPDSVYVAGEGCIVDPECDQEQAAYLCETTGGTWDPRSCGHYECGAAPACDAVIPGCDCGADQSFSAELGCQTDPRCTGEEGREGDVCDPASSHCGDGLACCYPCGIEGCEFECTAAIEGECPPPRP